MFRFLRAEDPESLEIHAGSYSYVKCNANEAQGMQMSVNQSVCLTETLIFLSDLPVYFIKANQTEMNQAISKHN